MVILHPAESGWNAFFRRLPVGNPGAPGSVARLKQIVEDYGWPTISMVGFTGARGAGIIALHAESAREHSGNPVLPHLMSPLDAVPAA
jgi:hypothetical protein